MKTLKLLIGLFSMLILVSLTAPPSHAMADISSHLQVCHPGGTLLKISTESILNPIKMTKKETAEGWLKIAVSEIQAKAEKLKVRDTGALIASISGSIQELSGGSAYKASILYNYYGIFPDMGIGKGIKRGDGNVSKLLGFKRKAKPWTKEIAAQRHRFGEVMGKAFADEAIKTVKEGLLNKVEFKA